METQDENALFCGCYLLKLGSKEFSVYRQDRIYKC